MFRLTHTLTHMHTLTLTLTLTLTHTHLHTLTPTLTLTLTFTHAQTHSHTLTCNHSHTRTLTHSLTHTLTKKYNKFRNEITNNKQVSKKVQYTAYFEQNKHKSADIWIKSAKPSTIQLFYEINNIVSDSEVINMFNEQFSQRHSK